MNGCHRLATRRRPLISVQGQSRARYRSPDLVILRADLGPKPKGEPAERTCRHDPDARDRLYSLW
jgi:hypothetical protein